MKKPGYEKQVENTIGFQSLHTKFNTTMLMPIIKKLIL